LRRWRQRSKAFAVTVTNLGYKNAYLSIQGPSSRRLLAR
jgi:glycine cleavage system aminomethyltransferase T